MSEEPAKPQSKIGKIEEMLMYPFQKGWFGIAIAVILVTFIVLAGLSSITNSAKPGDPAFVIDRTFEKLRVATSLSDSARFKHKVAITEERLEELLEFNIEDTDGILSSLDELELALLDVKAEMGSFNGSTEDEKSASRAIDNLLDLVARYRAFLLGETDDTADIQKELDDSVKEINNVVTMVNLNNPSAGVSPVQVATAPASVGNTSPAASSENGNLSCSTTYIRLGGEVEFKAKLDKDSCGEYTVKNGGITYVLKNTGNIDYALGQEVKVHGTPGTDNSIFITDFELDD